MNQSIGLFVGCVLSLSACNVENYEDCSKDDIEFEDDVEGGHGRAGQPATTPDPPEPPEPPRVPCEAERDCEPGFNCDLEAQSCLPADAETCAELLDAESCTTRADCTPIYAGVNCSCGADCECVGGEPGCICESFRFFACQPVE